MKNIEWDGKLQTGHREIDHHHEDLFALDRMLEEAIGRNDRGGLEKIVLFLELYVVEHFESEEALMSKIQEIDLKDGVLDGKVRKGPAKKCHECNRTMNRMHNKCLYCGATKLMDTPFEGV